MKLNKLEELLTDAEIITNANMGTWSLFKYFENLTSDDIPDAFKTILTSNNTRIDYYLSRKDKYLSVIAQRLFNNFKEQSPTTPNISLLAPTSALIYGILKDKYLQNWNKLYASLYADYNPINNYDMIENENTKADMKTETSDTQKYAGFNSGTSLPVASESEGSSETSGIKADNERTLTRSGNIGVTTSQQMIESEIKLREKTLLDIIFNDIDKILFMNYYG